MGESETANAGTLHEELVAAVRDYLVEGHVSEGGRIPELKRVIVAYQNQIVMEETLEAGLTRIFPPDGPRPAPQPEYGVPAPAAAVDDAAARAKDAFRRAIEAQRVGDWAGYGAEIERLGKILESMGGKSPER